MTIINANIIAELRDRHNFSVRHLVGDTFSPNNLPIGRYLAGRGSTYINRSNGSTYVNLGSAASPRWLNISGAYGFVVETGSILAADITGTGAGQLSHAAGVPIILNYAESGNIPNCLVPVLCMLKYFRAGASYTCAGACNLGFRLSDGTVLTATIAGASFILSASPAAGKGYVLPNLGTPFEVKEDLTMNLVCDTPPITNPGGATGHLEWQVHYAATFM